MKLTLANHPVTDLRAGDATRLDGTELTVNLNELRRLLLEDTRLESVDIEIVRPGEQSRIGSVFDILEPRAKEPGDGSDFPGILGPLKTAGRGTTHVLRGTAITVLDDAPGPGVGRIVEMSGPAAAECPYAALHHVVLVPHAKPDVVRHLAQNAQRLVSVKAAVYLARTAIGQPPASTDVYELGGPTETGREGLPRIAYIAQIQGRQRPGEVDEQVLYGLNTMGMVPTPLHPNEWMDGAVVIAYWNMAVETYFYQNHPVIQELYQWHHERKITFAGTIVTMAGDDNVDRARNAMFCAELAKWNLGADGAVLTKYGGGAPHTDMGVTAHMCEELGIKTSVQVQDSSADRTLESAMLFNYPDVDAIVAVNGNDIKWPVAQVEHIIAGNPAAAAALRDLKEVTAGAVLGIAGQQGYSRARGFVV